VGLLFSSRDPHTAEKVRVGAIVILFELVELVKATDLIFPVDRLVVGSVDLDQQHDDDDCQEDDQLSKGIALSHLRARLRTYSKNAAAYDSLL